MNELPTYSVCGIHLQICPANHLNSIFEIWAEFRLNPAVIFTEASRDIEPPKEEVGSAERERRPDYVRVAHVQRVRNAPDPPGKLLTSDALKWIFRLGFVKIGRNVHETWPHMYPALSSNSTGYQV